MDEATKKAQEDLTFSLAVLAWRNGEQDEAISLLSGITEVEFHECGKEGKASEMVYQGDQYTEPGTNGALDYYLCQECEDFYRKEETADDGEWEDEE